MILVTQLPIKTIRTYALLTVCWILIPSILAFQLRVSFTVAFIKLIQEQHVIEGYSEIAHGVVVLWILGVTPLTSLIEHSRSIVPWNKVHRFIIDVIIEVIRVNDQVVIPISSGLSMSNAKGVHELMNSDSKLKTDKLIS